MDALLVYLLATLSAGQVYSSLYHGPTAIPHVLHNGYLADTHEVAAAKSAHLASLAKYSHGHGYSGDHSYGESHDSGSYGGHEDLRYHGPTAIPHVLHNGHIADTHEVAAAKAKHFTAIAKAKSSGGYGSAFGYGKNYRGGYTGYYGGHGDFRYHGPIAIPHVLHDGHIADTHDVAAAKAEHFTAVAKAKAHSGYGQDYSGHYASGYGQDYSGQYASGYGADYGYSHHTAPYHGPLAKPVVLKSGYLADTHEVTIAKNNHLLTLHSSRLGHYNQ